MIFMPIVAALTEIGGINPVHMGVVLRRAARALSGKTADHGQI